MKRLHSLAFCTLWALGLISSSCTQSDNAATNNSTNNPPSGGPVDVYVAGIQMPSDNSGATNSRAVYWKNGTAVWLTDGSAWASAQRIFVVGSDVYVLGRRNPTDGGDQQAALWKNGVLQDFLPNPNWYVVDADINSTGIHLIVMDDAAHTYYVKNGAIQSFNPNDAPVAVHAVTVSGGDVYVCGIHTNGSIAYWKNGVSHSMTGISTQITSEMPSFKDIVVVGSTVYVTGNYPDTHPDNSPGTPQVGVVWKNGVPRALGYYEYTERMCVVGNDVYITGCSNNQAVYYKNGQPINLNMGATPMSSIAYGICSLNGNMYYSGASFNPNQSHFWINGVRTSINNAIGYDIVAVQP